MKTVLPNSGFAPSRIPGHFQAWLIGSGIASLAAAAHLINDANIPGSDIYILDMHSGPGGGMNPSGDVVNGYFLPFECHPHFQGSCMERFLSSVPSQTRTDTSLMDAVRTFKKVERPPPQDFALVRALKHGDSSPEILHTKTIHIGAKNRLSLIKLILESEKAIGSKTIKDMLDESFFKSTFWMMWATT